jgi:hypothetical protein
LDKAWKAFIPAARVAIEAMKMDKRKSRAPASGHRLESVPTHEEVDEDMFIEKWNAKIDEVLKMTVTLPIAYGNGFIENIVFDDGIPGSCTIKMTLPKWVKKYGEVGLPYDIFNEEFLSRIGVKCQKQP